MGGSLGGVGRGEAPTFSSVPKALSLPTPPACPGARAEMTAARQSEQILTEPELPGGRRAVCTCWVCVTQDGLCMICKYLFSTSRPKTYFTRF